jgi:hypothetical protein
LALTASLFRRKARHFWRLRYFLERCCFRWAFLMQTASHGALPKAVAIGGSALVMISLAGMTLGFALNQAPAED